MEQVADVVSVRVARPMCHPARDGDATKLGKRTRSNHKFGHSGSNANGRWHGIAQSPARPPWLEARSAGSRFKSANARRGLNARRREG